MNLTDIVGTCLPGTGLAALLDAGFDVTFTSAEGHDAGRYDCP